jgi:hypothetical protein
MDKKILELTFEDVYSIGANDSLILINNEVILIADYPLHSKENQHLRTLASLYIDSKKQPSKNPEKPLHYLYYSDTSKIKLSPIRYRFWLEKNNFAKYFPVDSRTYTFIKIDGKLIEETNEKRIKDYVLDDLKKNSIGGDYSFYDYMALEKRAFTADFLSQIESSPVEFKKDTADTGYFYYRNCIVKVTANKSEIIQYKDVDEYVWKNQVIPRDYHETDHHGSEFRTFLYCVSNKDMNKYKSIQSALGYMLHSYKTRANNKAVILNDMVISDNPDGRSGKGLFCEGISHMKKLDSLNGKIVDFSKQFNLQTVQLGCQVLVFDDVKRNFNFENLFSLITEGITLEYKNQPAVKLPVEKSPKIIITTNYTIGGVGGSHEARRFEVEFCNYFNVNYTPEMEFGHRFFEEWDKTEWQRFDNFMIRCLQVYLQSGLVDCVWDNIEVKKYIRLVGSAWHEFTKDHDFIEYNTRVSKQSIFNKFYEDFPDAKKYYTDDRKKHAVIDAYCKFYGFEFEEGNTTAFNLGRWVMIKKPNTNGEIPNIPFFDPNESAF